MIIGIFQMVQTGMMKAATICFGLSAGLAGAQLLPGGLGAVPGQLVGGVLQPVTGGASAVGTVVSRLDAPGVVEGLDRASLLELRRARLRTLIRDNRAVLDADDDGNPIRRAEIIVIDPAPGVLARAEAAGFARLRGDDIETLGQSLVVLAPPRGKDAVDGLKQLRKMDPQGDYELNHVFEPAGGALGRGSAARASSTARGRAIGMIDGGVAAHPALAAAAIEQRGFAPDGPRPSGHGTAIASLIVGGDGRFAGAARGATLIVADVYGGNPAAGSAELIARAIGWLASRQVKVITISLVGPPNRLIGRAVAAAQARGILIVAAVGNDGPAAPPQYPASFPGVIAVTGVDAKGRALMEAGRASHLDFAAPGADMAAALPGQGYAAVRGTSFAAPLVAARLALAPGDGAKAVAHARAEVEPGKGRVGFGILCRTCRIEPKLVLAKK